jgi:hypothetical protein
LMDFNYNFLRRFKHLLNPISQKPERNFLT